MLSTIDLQQEINQAEKHDLKQKSETQHDDVKTSKGKGYDLRYRPNILPDPVRGRLEDVVGLKSMPHQCRDYVVPAVEKYRQDKLKLNEQDRNIQRKLAQLQLQLGELQGKQKVKGQALLAPGATEQILPPSTAMNFTPLTPAVTTQPPCPL